MISLKQHIDVSLSLDKDGFNEYIESLPLSERIDFVRDVTDTYPLTMGDSVSDYISENFTFHDNVFDLVLGQFIMIEQILTGKFKFKTSTESDLQLANFLFRPKDEVEFDNEDPEKEEANRVAILNIPVQDFYNALNNFLKKREFVLFKQFSGVFYDATKEDEDEKDVSDSQSYGEDSGVDFNQQWYWYSIVRTLANENILMYDKVYMLKMSAVLPEMSYLAQKNKVESANQRAQQALNRL